MPVIPERLEQLRSGAVFIERKLTRSFEDGHSVLNVLAWLQGIDSPDDLNGSFQLHHWVMELGEVWDDEQRQSFVDILPRLADAPDDNYWESGRGRIVRAWRTRFRLATWLDALGMSESAERLRDPFDDDAFDDDALEDAYRQVDARWKAYTSEERAKPFDFGLADRAADAVVVDIWPVAAFRETDSPWQARLAEDISRRLLAYEAAWTLGPVWRTNEAVVRAAVEYTLRPIVVALNASIPALLDRVIDIRID